MFLRKNSERRGYKERSEKFCLLHLLEVLILSADLNSEAC